jgi:hypothetical protein
VFIVVVDFRYQLSPETFGYTIVCINEQSFTDIINNAEYHCQCVKIKTTYKFHKKGEKMKNSFLWTGGISKL